MIRLFVSDLDGTALDDNHLMPESSIKAIKRLNEAGIEFMAASGRSLPAAIEYLEPLDYHSGYLGLNGSILLDEDRNVLFGSDLSEQQIRGMFDIMKDMPGAYAFEDGLNGRIMLQEREVFQKISKEFYAKVKWPVYSLSGDYLGKIRYGCSLETVISLRPRKAEITHIPAEWIEPIRKRMEMIPDSKVVGGGYYNLELTPAGSSKGDTLLRYCRIRGIDPDEVLVIGDSENDATMLAAFKTSFAMGNAPENIKKLCTYVVPSNEEGGFVQAVDWAIDHKND